MFLALALHDVWKQNQLQMDEERGVVMPGVTSSVLLFGRTQFLGDARSPYTLVEFGDYQCPFCRKSQALIHYALSKYEGKLKLDFRQFPLTQIHPYADSAAVAAESSRPNGSFWEVHSKLFEIDLSNKQNLSRILAGSRVALDPRFAHKQITMDEALAYKLSVDSTPSFFLCCPDARVIRLPRIQAIDLDIK